MRSSRSQQKQFAQYWPSGRFSVTSLLVAITLAAGSAEIFLMLFERPPETHWRLLSWLGLHRDAFTAGHAWQFVSFMLLHPNPAFLAVNIVVLFFAGREVEPIIGVRHFAILYLLGNLLGGLAQWLAMALGLAPAEMVLAGISAGTAAVLAAYATILPELELTTHLFYVLPLRIKARTLGLGLLLGAGVLWAAEPGASVGPAAIFAGTLVGWIYVKQLGFGNPMLLERYLFDRRQHAARLERMPAEQFVREELDPILEKIARSGKGSLSRSERKLLEKGRAKLAARDLRPCVRR